MRGWPDWTGLSERRWPRDPDEELRPAKTAWDWLQLVAVPLALAVLALVFNGWQSEREADREKDRAQRDREIAREARRDDILQKYVSDMSELVLDRRLLRAPQESNVQSVARTLTLTTLRRVDGRRKGEVVKYLMDSRLLGYEGLEEAVKLDQVRVDLSDADLRGVDLRAATVSGSFEYADLREARFDKATVDHAWFRGADLRSARFDGGNIDTTRFLDADLREASFRRTLIFRADFFTGNLRDAVFDRADLAAGGERLAGEGSWHTNFSLACLTEVSFRKAKLAGAQWGEAFGTRLDFAGASSLKGNELTDAHLINSNVGAARVVGPLPAGWGTMGRIEKRGESSPFELDC